MVSYIRLLEVFKGCDICTSQMNRREFVGSGLSIHHNLISTPIIESDKMLEFATCL